MLAGVSVEYYTRLERGDLSGVSEDVLEGLAGALQLDEVERAHLFDLARAAQTTTPPRRRATKQQVRPSVQRILDAMTAAPAYVRNGRWDILAANRLGYALYSPLYAGSARPVNTARFVFLDPHAADFFVDWERVATEVVAVLRSAAGRDPYDRGLSDAHRRALAAKRAVSNPVGRAQRPLPRQGHQTPPSPRRRRAHSHLRNDAAHRRRRADHGRLHRRARLHVGGSPEPAR